MTKVINRFNAPLRPIQIVVHDKRIRVLKYSDKKYYIDVKIGYLWWSKWVQVKPAHKFKNDALKIYKDIKAGRIKVKFEKNDN